MEGVYEVLQWLGKGGCKIDKVIYGYGRIIPHEKVDPATLAEWRIKNLVGSIPQTRPPEMTHLVEAVDKHGAENKELKLKVKLLESVNADLDEKVAKLEKRLMKGKK